MRRVADARMSSGAGSVRIVWQCGNRHRPGRAGPRLPDACRAANRHMQGGQSEHGLDDPLAPAKPAAPLTCLRAPPDLGDYVDSPSIDLWTNRRITSEGQEILLAGRSRRPSAEQAR